MRASTSSSINKLNSTLIAPFTANSVFRTCEPKSKNVALSDLIELFPRVFGPMHSAEASHNT